MNKLKDSHETQKADVSQQENNLESVLKEFKLSGRYHLRLLLLASFLGIFSAEQNLNYMITAEDINYRCNQPNCNPNELLKLDQNSTLDFKCKNYDLINHNDSCSEDNFDMSSATDCVKWDYDKPNSFVAEFDLGCEDWKRTLVGSMHSIGYAVGLISSGLLSDKIGRKKLLIFNLLITAVLGVAKSFVTSYWIFVTLEMLEPIFEFYSITFTIVIEMITKQQRLIIVAMFGMCASIGIFAIAILGFLTSSWRVYLRFVYSPPIILALIYVFFMDESLRWLLIKEKKLEAQETIRRAAKKNNITIDESKMINLNCENSSSAKLSTAIKITLASKKLLLRFMICICMWFTATFNVISLFLNSASLGGNKYLNHMLVGSCGAIAALIILFVLPKFQKKGSLILAFTLTGACCVGESFVPKEYRWVATFLYLCGKINASICLRICYLYTTELFPTYTRNTMLGLCSSLGRIASVVAPQTPLLAKYWLRFPSFVIGILSLITASVVTLMPDTSDEELPDNVQQAEAIGNNQK